MYKIEEGNGSLFQYLAWEIPRTEEPGRLQSRGLQNSGITQRLNHHHTVYKIVLPWCSVIFKKKIHLPMQEMKVQSLGWEDPQRKKWQPTPIFLPGKSHGQRSLMGWTGLSKQTTKINNPKIYTDPQKTQKKNKARGIMLPHFRQYYKATLIERVQYWQKNRHTDQQNRMESPEITPHSHSQLIFDRRGKNMQWTKDHLFHNWYWKSWTVTSKSTDTPSQHTQK